MLLWFNSMYHRVFWDVRFLTPNQSFNRHLEFRLLSYIINTGVHDKYAHPLHTHPLKLNSGHNNYILIYSLTSCQPCYSQKMAIAGPPVLRGRLLTSSQNPAPLHTLEAHCERCPQGTADQRSRERANHSSPLPCYQLCPITAVNKSVIIVWGEESQWLVIL